MLILTFKALHGTAPAYIPAPLSPNHTSRSPFAVWLLGHLFSTLPHSNFWNKNVSCSCALHDTYTYIFSCALWYTPVSCVCAYAYLYLYLYLYLERERERKNVYKVPIDLKGHFICIKLFIVRNPVIFSFF